MSSVSANMVLILARPSLRSHPSRGEALKRQRDREETWRDRHSRSTTTLTARSPHFRFRGTDPELHVPLLLCGYLSRKKAASRKFRGLKARAGPSLARVGNTVRSEDGGVVERLPLRWCVSCSPSPLAYLTTRILSCGVWTSPSAPPPWPKSQANTPGFGCSPRWRGWARQVGENKPLLRRRRETVAHLAAAEVLVEGKFCVAQLTGKEWKG